MTLQKVQLQCMVCQKPLEMDLGKPMISNASCFSMVIIEHPKEVACPNCGTVVRGAIVGVHGLAVAAVPVPPEQQQSMIVTPGAGLGGKN